MLTSTSSTGKSDLRLVDVPVQSNSDGHLANIQSNFYGGYKPMLCDSNNSCVMAMAIATANADGSSVVLGLIDDQGGFVASVAVARCQKSKFSFDSAFTGASLEKRGYLLGRFGVKGSH